jgi:uncharacterized protein (TIGR02391 family)
MSLKSNIKPELWLAIESSYTSSNYSHAIRDAMSFVTNVLRDKSGLDGDGDALVGRALGFKQNKRPRLMINRFQTQTEKDMQRGLMYTLKGMYALVRNPRVHERKIDNKNDADTIIVFIDYITNYLGKSQQSFTVQDFIEKVMDPHFVNDTEYIEELIKTIPIRKRMDTIIAVYRKLNWKHHINTGSVIKALLKQLNDSELKEFLKIVSYDLQKAQAPQEVTIIIKTLPHDLWTQIEKMPRLRAENMLVHELDESWYIPDTKKTNNTSGTWISKIARYYIRKNKLRKALLNLLESDDFDKHNYVAKYFLRVGGLEDIFEETAEIQTCVKALVNTLEQGNIFMKESIMTYLNNFPGPEQEWLDIMIPALQQFTDENSPEAYTVDGIPVFGAFTAKPNPASEPATDNDIPF